jgi:cell cycle sensor histidine kinase DivJ
LVTNAIKFSDPGGTVSVRAGVDGEHVWLEVADAGIGIAPHDLARIGNPFFQVQGRYGRKHDGAGLGLSIVKALVDLHGGALKAESRPGEGTRMVVRLPLDCACVATSLRPIPIANAIRDDIPNALSEKPATSGRAADPSASQPGGMNSPASFPLPVQRRA